MKLLNTKDAVGHVLCHDITRIVKGVTKGVAFSKGHIIREEDVDVLLSLGKDHIYIWENKEGYLHENEAAEILCNICKGENVSSDQVKEGKIELTAECDGLLKINLEKLKKINSIDEIMIATIHSNFPVKKGDKLAGTRVIPLVIDEKKLIEAKEIGGAEPLINIKKFKSKKAAIITTGSEVFYGRIKDTFTPVIEEKLSEYDVQVVAHEIIKDDLNEITEAIRKHIDNVDMIVCTGGMSVDPDDLTPSAIKNVGGNIVSYGAPVLPGAMFLLSYYNGKAIMGLPGCVMYSRRTIFDLILPRIIAEDKVTKEDLVSLGHGGLCLNCDKCIFPKCAFGKGV